MASDICQALHGGLCDKGIRGGRRQRHGAGGRRPHRRAVQVDRIKTRVESAYGVCNQRWKLQYDETLSKFCLKINLRRYITVVAHAEGTFLSFS